MVSWNVLDEWLEDDFSFALVSQVYLSSRGTAVANNSEINCHSILSFPSPFLGSFSRAGVLQGNKQDGVMREVARSTDSWWEVVETKPPLLNNFELLYFWSCDTQRWNQAMEASPRCSRLGSLCLLLVLMLTVFQWEGLGKEIRSFWFLCSQKCYC